MGLMEDSVPDTYSCYICRDPPGECDCSLDGKGGGGGMIWPHGLCVSQLLVHIGGGLLERECSA